MIRRKDGFSGERSVVLPPMVIDMERNDAMAGILYVTDIGYYPNAANHYRNRDQPINEYVLIYCVDGNGWYQLRNREYKVSKGQFFILPAGIPHIYGAEEGHFWTIYWVHFSGELAGIYAEGAQVPQMINITQDSRISDRNNIFEEILTTLQQSYEMEYLRYASSVLHHYLASMRFLRQYRDASGKQVEFDPTDAAIHYMKENIGNCITLQDVLHYVGYSQSHFSAMFKKSTGQSPLNYFNKLKMEFACQLLRDTDLKINQICYKVGIEDNFYFSRLFAKVIGMSPTQYRETHKKE